MWVIGGKLIHQDMSAIRLEEPTMKGCGRKETTAYSVGRGDPLEVEFGQDNDNIAVFRGGLSL